ncbi:MAG: hypothetical protein HZC36_05180 [Armatimonadetes bacterium]|nr:hypothetical protein [Armatimonadota bacterium]
MGPGIVMIRISSSWQSRTLREVKNGDVANRQFAERLVVASGSAEIAKGLRTAIEKKGRGPELSRERLDLATVLGSMGRVAAPEIRALGQQENPTLDHAAAIATHEFCFRFPLEAEILKDVLSSLLKSQDENTRQVAQNAVNWTAFAFSSGNAPIVTSNEQSRQFREWIMERAQLKDIGGTNKRMEP